MSEKTEQPTHKKLRDAKERGDVPKSADLSKAVMFGVFALATTVAGETLVRRLLDVLALAGSLAPQEFAAALPILLDALGGLLLEAVLPLALVLSLAGLVTHYLYTGAVFAPEKIKLNFENIDPLGAVKRWFSLRNLVEFLKSITKATLLCVLVAVLLLGWMGALLWMPIKGVDGAAQMLAHLFAQLLSAAAGMLAVVALIDAFVARRLYTREHKMAKHEVKQDHKDSQGDPHIKGRQRQIRHELAQTKTRAAIRQSSAVLVNPTHIAVAVRHVPGHTVRPIVMAMGAGAFAEAIIKTALAERVPVVRQIDLARRLYATAQPLRYVPDDLVAVVISVLESLEETALQLPPLE